MLEHASMGGFRDCDAKLPVHGWSQNPHTYAPFHPPTPPSATHPLLCLHQAC